MQQAFIDNFNQASKQAFAAGKEIADLNTSTFQTMLDKQLEITNQLATVGAKQSRLAAEVKDVPSALEAQSALVQEITEQAASNAREAVALVNQTREAYDKLFQKSLKDAEQAFKNAQAGFTAA